MQGVKGDFKKGLSRREVFKRKLSAQRFNLMNDFDRHKGTDMDKIWGIFDGMDLAVFMNQAHQIHPIKRNLDVDFGCGGNEEFVYFVDEAGEVFFFEGRNTNSVCKACL